MSDPIKPVGPGGVAGVDAADLVEQTTEVSESTSTSAVETTSLDATSATDPLQRAIAEVKADISTGAVPDADAAADAVIIRLVNLRYGHLPEAQRKELLLHVHESLHNDPMFRERIDQLLALSTVETD